MISEYPAGAARGVGGLGSGRQGGRPTVEAGFALDINKLLRVCRAVTNQASGASALC
jgi:hypothetical protein